jgi:DnaJ like chaperone protein
MKEVQEIFNRERRIFYDYEKYLYKLYDIFSNNRDILLGFLEEMFKFSHEDGGVHPEQEKIMQKAVQVFRLSSDDYKEIKNKFIEELDKYYSVLNCNRSNTDKEIKSSYSKLIMRYHPDKYAANDLPEEMLCVAKEKTQDIQESYEKIRKSRNF